MSVALPLSALQIEKIKSVGKAVLLDAETITGVPWQALAGLWFRESFCRTAPSTPGGPFQFDPVPGPDSLRILLLRFTRLTAVQIEHLVAAGVNDFQSGAVFAACWLRNSTAYRISVDAAPEAIKDALYGYNGRGYGGADLSPYVMNGFDAAHLDMVLHGTIPDGQGHRIKIETVDHRPGAFTVYTQLKEEQI